MKLMEEWIAERMEPTANSSTDYVESPGVSRNSLPGRRSLRFASI